MGALDWLFGRRTKREARHPVPSNDVARVLPADVFDVTDLDRLGRTANSANGRFRLVRSESASVEDQLNGTAMARYALVEGSDVLADGWMERPSDGKVADDGTFVLNSGRLIRDLSGTFHAFRRDGTTIISRDFEANLFNNGLSEDGGWAACHTANSHSEHDGGTLVVFDLRAGVEFSRFRAESGWPLTYDFSSTERLVRLRYANGGGCYAYGVNGRFLDRGRWIEERLASGDLRVARSVIDEAKGRPDLGLATRLLAGLAAALENGKYRDDASKATSLRLRGECHEGLGEAARALELFDSALTLWPGVGAKRRAERIRKILGPR